MNLEILSLLQQDFPVLGLQGPSYMLLQQFSPQQGLDRLFIFVRIWFLIKFCILQAYILLSLLRRLQNSSPVNKNTRRYCRKYSSITSINLLLTSLYPPNFDRLEFLLKIEVEVNLKSIRNYAKNIVIFFPSLIIFPLSLYEENILLGIALLWLSSQWA